MKEVGYPFCPSCGLLLKLVPKNSLPQVCESCGVKHFHPPSPVVVGLVVVQRKIETRTDYGLLCVHRRRKTDDSPVQMAFPGGYQNRGESLESALSRELFQETGVRLHPNSWRYVGSSWSTTENESVIFFCTRGGTASAVSWEIAQKNFEPNDEVEGLGVLWFSEISSYDNKPLLCFSTHHAFAMWFFTQGLNNDQSVFFNCRP